MSDMKTCRGCGKEMVWAKTADGRAIPIDLRPVIYRIIGPGPNYAAARVPTGEYAVSHFATCPKASEFSSRGKKAQS